MVTDIAVDVVGRGRELALFDGAVRDLGSGRGRSLLIEGEPGIGKSTLLAAGLDGIAAGLLRGACDELGQRFPLSVMLSTLGVDARSTDPLRAATALALTSPVAPRPGDRGWSVSMLAGDPVVAAIEQLLSLVDRLCTGGPLVLAVDDLHWADDASLLLWRRLSQATVQLPLLLVGTCRPVPQHEDLDRLRRDLRNREAALISLERLSPASVADLIERSTGGRPGPRLASRLESAAGNPLYVRELFDALFRTGALTVSPGAVEIAETQGPSEMYLAHDTRGMSLTGVMATRLDYLSPETRAVLRMAALLGPEFSVTDLAHILERPAGALADAVEEAITARVLEPAAARLRFRHGLLKEALYEAIPEALRRALHRQAAEALIAAKAPVERVAQLILSAPQGADGWEVDWLAQHATTLAHRAPATAAELLDNALPHTPEDDRRYAVLEDHLASVAFLLARHEQVEQITRSILISTSDPNRVGQATWLLGFTLLRTGRLDEALELIRDVTESSRADPVWQARLSALKAMPLITTGRFSEGNTAAASALAQGEKLADAAAQAWALHAHASACMIKIDSDAGLSYIHRALAVVGADPELVFLRQLLMTNQAIALFSLERDAEATAVLKHARTLAERTGTKTLALIQLHTAEHEFMTGRWDDALTDLEAISELPEQVYQPLKLHGYGALIAGHRDDSAEAVRHLDVLRDHPLSLSYERAQSGPLLMARALEAERAGDLKQAARILAAMLTPDFGKDVTNRAPWMPSLVRWTLATSDLTTANAAADVSEAEEQRESVSFRRGVTQWCRGLVDGNPKLVLAAADLYRAAQRPLQLGNALEDAAVLLAENGRLDEARTAFAEAQSVYATLGAVWDARRAAKRLRPHGIRTGVRGPRQRPTTGWGALTPTELRVAELVAQGRSNPDIAERLLLSRRTVETHVSHILAKLQATSRREIADLAERHRH